MMIKAATKNAASFSAEAAFFRCLQTCDIDANDADCIIQLGLFGKVIYG